MANIFLTVADARAGMCVEVAAGHRILVRQKGNPLLAARVQRWMSHVDYARAGAYEPITAPIRAEQTRRIGGDGEKWAHHFAAALIESEAGPLHDGRWMLQPEAPHLFINRSRDEVVLADRVGVIDWYYLNGEGVILCLRDLSDMENGRVKAYRKHLREGIIAPVLLWWHTGLTAYLVLDGHDRLQACLAEGVPPPLLTLSRLRDDPLSTLDAQTAQHEQTVAHIQRAIANGTEKASGALAAENRRFATAIENQMLSPAPTRARLLPGGRAEWQTAWESLGGVSQTGDFDE